MNGISVIIPTYNERDNLPELLERIDSALGGRGYEVIVVDDDSPDRTWDSALSLSGKYPVKTIRRKGKRSLSTAILSGVEASESGLICVMDADLQHPPEKIPELVREIKKGHDMAIASRYIPGGGIRNWGILRRTISFAAKGIVRLVFPSIRKIEDNMSGFFVCRRKLFSERLNPAGFKILLEILVLNDCSVSEVPYVFERRKRGKSSLSPDNCLLFLRHMISLRRRYGKRAGKTHV